MRFSRALLTALLGLSLVPLSVAAFFMVTSSESALQTALFERHLEASSSLSRDIERYIETVSADLGGYGALLPIQDMGDSERQELVRLILAKRRDDFNMVTLWVGDDRQPAAAAFWTSPNSHLARLAHEQEVMRLREAPEEQFIGLAGVRQSHLYRVGDGKPAVTILAPAGDGVLLAAELNLDHIQATVAAAQQTSITVYVIDPLGRLVAHPDVSRVLASEKLLPREIADPGTRRVSGTRTFNGPDGPQLGAWAPIGGLGWTVVVSQPKSVALAPVRNMTRLALLIACIAGAAALAVSLLMARSMSQPLQRMVTAALKIARGGFGVQASVKSRNEIGELAHTFNYMSKQLAQYDSDRKRLYEELERGYLETIRALANSIDAKDNYTRGHSQRVTELSVETARELELDDHEIKVIQFGAILHDIGKIGIKDSVLRKNSALTDEEYEYMKTHPALGVAIVDPIDFLQEAKPIIRNHHERFDGRGYPDGLAGDDIPMGAMIVNIADAYDAMVTQRPYNTPMTFDQAVNRLKEIAGTMHDPRVTEAFLRVLFRRRAEEEVGGVWRSAKQSPAEKAVQAAEEKLPKIGRAQDK